VGLALLGAAGTDTALTGLLAGWDRVLSPAVLNLTPSSSATCHRLGARVAGDVAAGEETAAGPTLVRAVPARGLLRRIASNQYSNAVRSAVDADTPQRTSRPCEQQK
jgi:hypothetical protein